MKRILPTLSGNEASGLNIYPIQGQMKKIITRVEPIYRPEDEPVLLVDDVLGLPVLLGNNQVGLSYPILINTPLHLLDLSQRREFLKAGDLSLGSSIDRNIRLETVYLKVSDQIFQYPCGSIPYVGAVPSPHVQLPEMQLDFKTPRFSLNKNSVDIHGRPFKHSSLLALYDGSIEFILRLQGSISLIHGASHLTEKQCEVFNVISELLNTDEGNIYATLVKTVIGKPKVVAYNLEAYFAN